MIKVIIERQIREDSFQEYFEHILRARKQASNADGFIAGELLQMRAEPARAFVISNWESFETWKNWFDSEERKQVMSEMREFLECDEKISVLEPSQHFEL